MLRTNYIILNWWPSFHFIKRYLFYYSSAKRTRKRQSLVNDFCIQDATESRTITVCLLKSQKLKCSQSECYTVVLPRTIFQRSTDSSIIYSTNKTGWENWSSYYQLSYYAHGNRSLWTHPREEYWFEKLWENRHNPAYDDSWQYFQMSGTTFESIVKLVKRTLEKRNTQIRRVIHIQE